MAAILFFILAGVHFFLFPRHSCLSISGVLKCFLFFQGFVHLLGEDRPSILQAVYELYDLETVEPTPEDVKQCRFIFIGKFYVYFIYYNC